MYQADSSGDLLRSDKKKIFRRGGWKKVSPMVFLLGLTSFFTDISSEMVTAVLPIYAVFMLELSVAQYGVLDGLHQGASVVIRLFAGVVADRFGRLKEVATFGYALGALSKIFLLFGETASWLSGIILVDRLGKGIRTPPRDALIAEAAAKGAYATAFGIHRALDTAGAMLGPLMAFLILWILPGNYRGVFLISIAFSVIGVSVIGLFVRNGESRSVSKANNPTFKDFLSILKIPKFKTLVVISGLLALLTLSDSFIYLSVSETIGVRPALFPLLYVGTALVFMLLAIPVGLLADRKGKKKVFLAGYLLLGLAYLLVLKFLVSPFVIVFVLLLLGLYYACTDGVLVAALNELLPSGVRATGTALLTTVVGVAKILSSILFGFVWSQQGEETALLYFLIGLLVSLCIAGFAFSRLKKQQTTV